MAASDNSDGAGEPPTELEATARTLELTPRYPRRQVTLVAITVLLNVLLWSSLICLATTIYQIAARPDDTTNIPSAVLLITSVRTATS